MSKPTENPDRKMPSKLVLALLLLVPVVMYTSIMYKIVHYGP